MKTIYLENGSVWSAMTGCAIENPAILVDKDSDVLLKYGEANAVRKYYNRVLTSYQTTGRNPDNFVLIELDSEVYDLDSMSNSRTIQCYILKRAIEYSASGFLPNLIDHIAKGDVADWLEEQMQRVPLDLN